MPGKTVIHTVLVLAIAGLLIACESPKKNAQAETPETITSYAAEIQEIQALAEEKGKRPEDLLFERADFHTRYYGGNLRDLAKAQAFLDAVLVAHPDSAKVYVAKSRAYLKSAFRARRHYLKDDLDRAMASANKAISLDPKLPEAYLAKAFVYICREDYPPAHGLVDEAEKLGARPADVAYARAFLAGRENYQSRAYDYAMKVLETASDPLKRADALGLLANIYRRRRQYDEADQAYQDVLELAPHYNWYRVDYCDFLLKRDRLEEALPICEKAQKRWNRRFSRYLLAEAYTRKALTIMSGKGGSLEESLDISGDLLDRAVRLGPRYPDTRFALGLYYRHRAMAQEDEKISGEFNEKAAEAFQKTLELDKAHAEARIQLDALKSMGVAI